MTRKQRLRIARMYASSIVWHWAGGYYDERLSPEDYQAITGEMKRISKLIGHRTTVLNTVPEIIDHVTAPGPDTGKI